MKKALFAGVVALGVTVAAPAQAAVTVVGPAATEGSCASVTFTGISPIACAGGYTGNLISGNVNDPTGLAALAALGAPGGVFLEKLPSLSGNTVDFSTLLTGITVIGIHYGNGSRLGNATSFFKFDAGAGVDSFQFTLNGLSNAAIFSTGGGGGGGGLPGPVPEPATWAMMLAGFGFVGLALRRRRHSVRVKFA